MDHRGGVDHGVACSRRPSGTPRVIAKRRSRRSITRPTSPISTRSAAMTARGDAARDADPVRRSAARAGERAELVPVRSGHPLRDQDRQQQRRRRGRHVPVPLHDGAAPAGPVPGVRRGRRRRQRARELAGAGAAGHADRAAADHVASTRAGSAQRQTLHRDDGEERRVDAARQRRRRSTRCPPNVGPRTMDYDALFNAARSTTWARTCKRVRRHDGRSVLDRSGRRVRHAEPARRRWRRAFCRRAGRGVRRTSRPTPCPATR